MGERERRYSLAMLLDGKGGARELDDEQVREWSPGDGLLWIDLNLNSKAGRHWLVSESGINSNAVAVLLAGETRPRSLSFEDGLAVIMRGINMSPGAVPDDMVAVRMYLQRDRIVTTRRRKIGSVKDVRDRLLAGNGPRTVGEFLVVMTNCLADHIETAVENIENQLDDLSTEVVGGDIAAARSNLSGLRRQAAAIRRYLAPQRDAIERLARTSGELLREGEIFDLREEADHLTRYVENLDLARENALVIQEELMNRIAQEQNARMYLLSIVAAIFLPLSFVTGLLGMNVAGLPGTENPNAFIFSALVMIVLGVGLVGFFRWKKWI